MRNIAVIAMAAIAAPSFAASWTWTFDGNYNEMGSGVALGSHGTQAFEATTINGQNADVLKLTKGSFLGGAVDDPWLSLANPIGGNAGGSRTNQYTVLMDVFIPAGDYQSLLQTGSSHNPTASTNTGVNDNDGDWFIRGDGGMGISGDYTDTGNSTTFTDGAWTRIVRTIDTTSPASGDLKIYRSYVNGSLQNICQAANNWGLDGRQSLGQNIWFFADEDREVRDMWWVNNIMLFDYALTDNEVAAYGGAQAGAPTPVPEPASLALLAGAGFVAMRRKARN